MHPWTVAPLTKQVARTQSALGSTGDLELTAPTDRLAELSTQARAGGRHLLLLGGEVAALLLAFVLVAAGGLRRDAQATRRRLTWRGARRWQLALVGLVELAAVALVGTVVGWALGSAIGAWIASAAGGPAGALLGHSTLGALGLAAALALAFAATLLLAAAVLLPPLPLGRSVGALDALAIGAAAAAGVALARGSVGPGDLASGSGTTLVLVGLPLLVALLVGVAAARALAPLLRAVERRTRGAGVPLRLAALSLARRPGPGRARRRVPRRLRRPRPVRADVPDDAPRGPGRRGRLCGAARLQRDRDRRDARLAARGCAALALPLARARARTRSRWSARPPTSCA